MKSMDKIPMLVSYAYHNSLDWSRIRRDRKKIDLIVDSGAFTAYKQGNPIDLDAYCSWLKEHPMLPHGFRYMNLDVIGDAERSLRNYKLMLKRGLRPIPIFTRGAPEKHLEEYYESSELVAIGGIQMKSDNAAGYLKHITRLVDGRPVHWLGYTIRDHILAWKPTSVDSVNWKSAILYGRMEVFHRGRFVSMSRMQIAKHFPLLERLGIDIDELSRPESWKGAVSLAHKITTRAHLEYISRLKQACDTTFYLGVLTQTEYGVLMEAQEHIKGET